MNFSIHKAIARAQGGAAAGKRGRSALRPPVIIWVLLGVVLAGGVGTGLAKEKKPPSKTVTGVVFDAAGNIIFGATVELKDLQTGKLIAVYSQEDGHYQFAGLSFDHDYKIKATYKHQSSDERQISSLDTRSRPVFNLTIPGSK